MAGDAARGGAGGGVWIASTGLSVHTGSGNQWVVWERYNLFQLAYAPRPNAWLFDLSINLQAFT